MIEVSDAAGVAATKRETAGRVNPVSESPVGDSRGLPEIQISFAYLITIDVELQLFLASTGATASDASVIQIFRIDGRGQKSQGGGDGRTRPGVADRSHSGRSHR